MRDTEFQEYDVETLEVEALLFQTGYITIKEAKGGNRYVLGYPNKEVKVSFTDILFRSYTEVKDREKVRGRYYIEEKLRDADIEGFIDVMKGIFAGIGAPVGSKVGEAHFHTLFYVIVASCGIEAKTEVLSCSGRIDMIVQIRNKVYIMEFKCNQTPEKAIEQIKEKRYTDIYRGKNKEIYIIGINFSTKTRNIDGYRIERI